ncbi:L,D-transpeptidase family protein [Neobacillus drentensis]
MEQMVSRMDKEKVKKKGNSNKWYKNWKWITTTIIIIIGLSLAGMSYYQANHFNSQIIINGTNVGGLTADEALKKLKTSVLENVVYVGEQQIFDGKDTLMAFTSEDLPAAKQLLKKQWSFFPSFKEKNLSFMPAKQDQYRIETMKQQVEDQLLAMNESLKAPTDAKASLKDGKIVISESVSGNQYDVAKLVKEFVKQDYKSEIHLKPIYKQPIKEDSLIVKNEEKKLQELLLQKVDYKVQDKVYSLKASEVIKDASVSKDLKIKVKTDELKDKIAEINETQSTLDKNFKFKTHSGSYVTVKRTGYGWALDVDQETKQLKTAFEKGKQSISASNIIGHGWSGEGYGYEMTANNGLGDTYAEVSIAKQRIWIYKNGKLVVTSNVVTGKHSTGNDTSKGVWYILYKRSPSILTGRELGGKPSYEVKVNYWAPFTNDGQGFHDAGFRSNWASNAYLNAGSHGCVNTPPSVMKTVYENLNTYEPVVIY